MQMVPCDPGQVRQACERQEIGMLELCIMGICMLLVDIMALHMWQQRSIPILNQMLPSVHGQEQRA